MIYELRKRFNGTCVPALHLAALQLVDSEYRAAATKFELIHGDFLQQELPYFDVCCANVPYQVDRDSWHSSK